MKYFLLIFAGLHSIIICGQNNNSTINDALIFSAIKSAIIQDSIPIIKGDNLICSIVLDHTDAQVICMTDINKVKCVDANTIKAELKYHSNSCNKEKFFCKKDFNFFNDQLRDGKSYSLDSTDIKLFMKSKEYVSNYNQNYIKFYTPLFSKDLKTAYLKVENVCTLCGNCDVYILRFIDKKWKVVCKYNLWVS